MQWPYRWYPAKRALSAMRTRHAYAWQIGPFWQDTLDKALFVKTFSLQCWSCYRTMACSAGLRMWENKSALVIIFDWRVYRAYKQSMTHNVDGLVQERCNSSVLAVELHLYSTYPSISSLLLSTGKRYLFSFYIIFANSTLTLYMLNFSGDI